MKKLMLCLCISVFHLTAFNQQVYLQKIPVFPTTVTPDAVNTFLDKLSVLKDEINVLVAKYEEENRTAASKIDPNAVAAAYTQGNVNDIMNMQKKMEEMLANQDKLTLMQKKYNACNDSIKLAFEKEFAPYLEKHKNYYDLCVGEGRNATNCNKLKSELSQLGNKILTKYWFEEKSAVYNKYLLSILTEMQSLHVLCAVQSLESAEGSSGIKFPHKQDLAYLKFTLDYISYIKNAWNIDYRLWPL